jgi:hypothetical protein|tara:strand:- start:50 stop:883 length:834 start_codon:yes stop_codon:yes gene_type:complete
MIIWIASYPKSGNTLLRSILCSLIASNNGILDPKKLSLIPNFSQKRFFQNLTKERTDIREISKYWIEAQSRLCKKGKFKFLKTHNSNCKIGENFFTNSELTAGVIYIVRDPRDVLCSASKHFDLGIEETKDILFNRWAQTIARKNIEHEITTFLGSWSDNYNSWINFNKNVLLIKFEDLVLEKKKTILKIINFLNKFFPLNINEEKLNNILKTTSFKNMSLFENEGVFKESVKSKNGKKISFFNKGLVDNWKSKLSKKTIEDIEIKFKNEMTKLDYI